MDEIVDYFSEDNEEKLGSAERFEVADKGLWKRWISVWVLNENGKFLFQKRSYKRVSLPNLWETCAGHVKENEDPYNAAIREIKEEAGIDAKEVITLGSPIKVDVAKSYTYPYLIKTTKQIEEYEINDEVQSFKYVTLDEVKDLFNKGETIFYKEYINEIIPRLEEYILV